MGLCLLVLGGANITAEDLPLAPPEAGVELFGAVRMIDFEIVSFVDPAGKKWIGLKASCETAIRAPMESIIAKLWDFEGSSKVFSRIEAVRVRSNDGTQAVTEQRTAVRMLGAAYVSNLVYLDTIARRADGTAEVGFEMIETDGSCRSAKGGWDLREFADGAGKATFVRYWIESDVAPMVPAQAFIMRSFGAADVRKTARELCAAMDRS